MKHILFILAFVLTHTVVFASGKVKSVVIKTAIVCDHCKACESCTDRIEHALYGKKGIKRVDIDDKKMTIAVAYVESKISLDLIKKTIAENGYDADDVKATPEAVAKLDGCCK